MAGHFVQLLGLRIVGPITIEISSQIRDWAGETAGSFAWEYHVRCVFRHRTHVVEIEREVLSENHAVPDNRVVLIPSENRRVPIERDGTCDLGIALIFKAHDR